MLDGWARRRIDPGLDAVGRRLAAAGVSADAVTIAAFATGMAAAAAVAAGLLWLALGLIVASRLCDGLDGAVAKAGRPTDRGGFLDITLDFAFYGAVPLGFVLLDPAANGVAGAVLLFSFYVNGASFLAFAALAAKRRIETEVRGRKSIAFTVGLAEATETLLVFVAMCLWPRIFPHLAIGFSALTLLTAAGRIGMAWRVLKDG